MKKLAVLGATGSIGESTLHVCRENPHLYQIKLLVAGRNTDAMFALCQEFSPQYVAMNDPDSARLLKQKLQSHSLSTEVIDDEVALLALLGSDKIDSVMAAIVGSAGLKTTLAAVQAGKEVFLANKESLVMSGALLMDLATASGCKLWPVDSEHNAIYQALSKPLQDTIGQCELAKQGVSKILLTGSGGPFLNKPIADFSRITPEQAIKHPNWSMGKKISIDSATMMNKGLEYIEARWLFNANQSQLEVIIHPQSVIHSMVEYIDGSVIAQMGVPDMRIPIAHVMGGEKRISSGAKKLNFFNTPAFTFTEPDYQRYPCLQLAINACYQGQQATTTLNAANEIAVQAFLEKRIAFNDIAKIVAEVLSKETPSKVENISHLLEIDLQARKMANELIKRGLAC